MKLFNFFKKRDQDKRSQLSSSYFETNISEMDLVDVINKAISTFQDNPEYDADQIINAIHSYCKDQNLALAMYRFIPVAYCRLLVSGPEYSDEFVLFKTENDNRTFNFSSDKIYNSVLAESKKRIEREFTQEKYLPILYQSADFNAINDALQNGSELEDLVCSASYFLEE